MLRGDECIRPFLYGHITCHNRFLVAACMLIAYRQHTSALVDLSFDLTVHITLSSFLDITPSLPVQYALYKELFHLCHVYIQLLRQIRQPHSCIRFDEFDKYLRPYIA